MEQRAMELLKTLSIRIPSVRIPVASLSGGQRQVVAIARALIGEPQVVILPNKDGGKPGVVKSYVVEGTNAGNAYPTS